MMLHNNKTHLREELHRLTQEGNYWGPKGAIVVSHNLCKLGQALYGHDPISGLSRTYYSAAGNAAARAKIARFPLKKGFWLFLAWYCRSKAMHLSDRLAHDFDFPSLLTDELSIRSSILRCVGRYWEALECSRIALSRTDISSNSRVLLEIGRGESSYALGYPIEAGEAYENARQLADDVEPATLVRYYRSRARWEKQRGNHEQAIMLLGLALETAERNDLADQVVKIKAAMKQ